MPGHQCAAATLAGRQCSHISWDDNPLCRLHRARAQMVRLFADLPEHVAAAARPRCEQCTRNALVGLTHCRQHEQLRPRPDLPPEQRCAHGHGCMRAAQAHQRCARHLPGFVRRQRMMIWHEMYDPGVIQVVERPDIWADVVAGWHARIGEPHIDARFVQTLEMTLARELRIPVLWNRHMGGHAPMDARGNIGWQWADEDDLPFGLAPAPPPRTELEGFVRDTQNIHTRVVTQQTNSALDILLNAEVPSNQKTITEIHMSIMGHVALGRIQTSLTQIDAVDRDVKRWYRVSTCRSDGDYLYKRTLDGLWAKIKTSSERQELEIRMWQEMVDSLGMCCDGHISRLTNVLCGFDEAFAPKLSPAELLQNRMAVIAGMEGGIILQVAEAMSAFKELKVPEDQWEAWIDAL